MVVAWWLGYSGSISWNVIAEGETLPFILETFQVGPLELPITIDAYLLSEWFHGGPLQILTWPSYLFILLISIAFIILNAFITTLNRFWYIVSMALVVVFLMSFQFEQLLLFGRPDKIALIIAYVLILPLSYYFHAIKPETLFRWRLLGFLIATVVFGLIIFLFSEVDTPFLFVNAYGFAAPVIITIIFILLVGAELLTGVIFLLTRTKTASGSSNNLYHFIIISGVYLLNLMLIFLYDAHYFGWKLDFISPYILFALSAVVGFYTYRYKEDLYNNIFSYVGTGAVFYILLAAISFFTIGYYQFTANDPVVNVFKEFIYYSQLGYGLIFLVYILSNFINPLSQGLMVYKILYKPMNMPYFTYRFAGTIATVALFLVTNYEIPLYSTFSSYYNGIGDLYAINDEDKVAEVYYIKGNMYGYNTHRSSYALASLAVKNGDEKVAAHYYSKAIQKRASEQAFVNLSNSFIDDDRHFEAIFTLHDGLKKFPKSHIIRNNLGILYHKTKEIDSAFVLILDALGNSKTEATAGVNLLNFVAKGAYEYDVDSLVELYADPEYLADLNNIKAIYNLNHKFYEDQVQVDSTLNLLTAYQLYNDQINKIFSEDTIDTDYLLALSQRRDNAYWKELLTSAAMIGSYYNGEVIEAENLMRQLTNDYYYKAGYYYNLMGLFCLKSRAPQLAVDYFDNAIALKYKDAKLNRAIALSEAGLEVVAVSAWKDIAEQGIISNKEIANQMLRIFHDRDSIDSDLTRFWNWKYSSAKGNQIKNELVLERLQSKEFKNQVLFDLTQYYLDNGYDELAIKTFGRINGVSESQQKLYKILQLEIADIRNDIGFIKATVHKDLNEITREERNRWAYYQMRIAEAEGDSLSALEYIEIFKNKDPFFERGVIGLSNHYKKHSPLESYSVLQKALELNKYSVRLSKEYILLCADLEFETYAEYELERIRELISSTEYNDLLQQYHQRLENAKSEFED